MTESNEHYQPIAERRYNHRGSTYCRIYDGETETYEEEFFGVLFYVEGVEYTVWLEDDNLVVYDYNDGDNHITDEKIITSIKAQIEEDQEIRHARKEVSKILSKDNLMLAEILEMHVENRVGQFNRTFKKDGIDFYAVGHCSPYEFYAGTKDGRKYVLSKSPEMCHCDEDDQLIEDENGDLIITQAEEHIREVSGNDWGYIGHL